MISINYIKFPWKKNFNRVPTNIKATLRTLNSNDIIVSSSKRIPKELIISGTYSHLGIMYKNSQVVFQEHIIPESNIGRYSSYNINGRDIVRKDLPMITKTYSAEVPNFGDWSSGSHDISWSKEVYQRDHWFPQNIGLLIECLNESKSYITFKFSLDVILSKDNPDFEEQLLYHCNLLQENCGVCSLFKPNASNSEYLETLQVDWELLPPGSENYDINLKTFMKKYPKPSSVLSENLKERLEFFESLKPQRYILGTSKFNQYFGAIFSNDLVFLENLKYGNAIYIFYEDWEELSKLSRSELLKSNTKNFIRIKHTNNWKHRVTQCITEATN